MARPKADVDKIKGALLAEAEKMLAESQGRRLVLSELAARIGISQSYAHRFFATKADLVRALAELWFTEVEAVSRAARSKDKPSEQLRAWVLGILRIKRDRFDANPELYRAYLDLAKDHMDLVATHTDAMISDLRAILRPAVAPDTLEDAVNLTEDATMLFRVPMNIAQFRHRATDERANAVVDALIAQLRLP